MVRVESVSLNTMLLPFSKRSKNFVATCLPGGISGRRVYLYGGIHQPELPGIRYQKQSLFGEKYLLRRWKKYHRLSEILCPTLLPESNWFYGVLCSVVVVLVVLCVAGWKRANRRQKKTSNYHVMIIFLAECVHSSLLCLYSFLNILYLSDTKMAINISVTTYNTVVSRYFIVSGITHKPLN